MKVQGITNEKVKFLEISTLNTDYYEEKYSQTAVRKCLIGKFINKTFIGKDIRNPSKMQSLNFEKKKITQGTY